MASISFSSNGFLTLRSCTVDRIKTASISSASVSICSPTLHEKRINWDHFVCCLNGPWNVSLAISGSLLRQPSNPFQHLTAQTKRVAISNTIFAMRPDLERTEGNPRYSMELGDDYLLLGPKDVSPHGLSLPQQAALNDFFGDLDVDRRSVYRWGRLRIPTEQTARSHWKELERCSDMA